MLRIEIKSASYETKNGTNKTTNRDWEINTQEGWILLKDRDGQPNPYPSKVVLNLEKENGHIRPYDVGMYDFDVESSLFIGDFNGLRLGRPILKRVQAKPLQAAA